MRAITLITASLMVCLLSGIKSNAAQDASTDASSEAAWSESVDGLQARIVLKRSQVMNGTPIIATYLALRNVSDVMSPMTIPFNDKVMTFRVTDADGNEVPKLNGPFDGHALAGTYDLVLPFRGELSFDYSMHGVGIPGNKAALIDLGVDANWAIERNRGDCFLRATLEVPRPKTKRDGWMSRWHGYIELPPVKIPVEGEPIDEATIESRINDLGAKLLSKDGRVAEQAQRELSLIDDPRTVAWYVKALDSGRQSLRFNALDQLSRYKSDEALASIKKCMTFQSSDLGDDVAKHIAVQSAEGVRHQASVALSRSPHPDAKRLLLTMWDDPYMGVRINVLHALGQMDTPESLEQLKKMSTDHDEIVRNEAIRYLKLRDGSKDE